MEITKEQTMKLVDQCKKEGYSTIEVISFIEGMYAAEKLFIEQRQQSLEEQLKQK